MNDPIADFIIRIKNSALSGKKGLSLPYSNVKFNLAKILQTEGYLEKVEMVENGNKKEILLSIACKGNKVKSIDVKRISKLGRRVYSQAKDLPRLNRGIGNVIISTPKGLMTCKKAIKENLGGEVICKII